MNTSIADFIANNITAILAMIGGAIAWVFKFQADARSRRLEEVNSLLQTHKDTAAWFAAQLDSTRDRYEEVLLQLENLRKDNHTLIDLNRELVRLNTDLKKRVQELEADVVNLSNRISERHDNASM